MSTAGIALGNEEGAACPEDLRDSCCRAGGLRIPLDVETERERVGAIPTSEGLGGVVTLAWRARPLIWFWSSSSIESMGRSEGL